MKSLIWFLCTGLIILAGCKSEVKNQKQILTSFYPLYISTLNVTDGVENISIVNLTSSQTGCLHDYQLTPGDAARLEKASVLVINGGGMETFLDKTLSDSSLLVIDASEGIDFLKGEENEGHDPLHMHQEEETNGHVWVSITLAMKQVTTIARKLAEWDSANASQYMKNAEIYCAKLNELKEKMHQELADYQGQSIITFHEAFPYFAQEFGLKIAAVVQQEPGAEPNAAELMKIIQTTKQKKVKALFVEPQYSPSAAQTISRETGIDVYTLDPVVTGPLDKNAYLNIMGGNLETLKKALK